MLMVGIASVLRQKRISSWMRALRGVELGEGVGARGWGADLVGSCRMNVMIDFAAVQVGNRETQVPIPPYQIAMFQAITAELFRLKIGANVAVPRAAEERLEVHNPVCPVIEKQSECENSYLRGGRNAHGMRHLTLLVSTSDVMRL